MEHIIERGDYVMLKPRCAVDRNPFVNKLYNDLYGRNGLVRKVTYAPSQPWKVAEVIFSGVPYISVVPVIYLNFIGKREEWPLRTRRFPEPNMMVADYRTVGITKKVGAVYFMIRGHEFEEQCRFEDGKVDILTPDYLIAHGHPEIKMYFDYKKYEKEKTMENEIKRGDYVELADTLDGTRPTIIGKLYDQHRDRIGLVRAVKYVPGYVGKIAEVIFSGVPYISEVPTKYLNRIGERLEYPGRNTKYPEPGMKVTSFGTDYLPAFVRVVIFKKKNDGFVELYSVNEKYNLNFILVPEDTITLGYPEIKSFYDCGYAPQYVYTDTAATQTLADLIRSSQNILKGESTMKNTNKKPTPSNPIKQVIFNGPATIVYWKNGSKTIVKCQEGAVNDPEKGLAMAISRHYLCDICGLERYDGIFKKYLPKETKEK